MRRTSSSRSSLPIRALEGYLWRRTLKTHVSVPTGPERRCGPSAASRGSRHGSKFRTPCRSWGRGLSARAPGSGGRSGVTAFTRGGRGTRSGSRRRALPRPAWCGESGLRSPCRPIASARGGTPGRGVAGEGVLADLPRRWRRDSCAPTVRGRRRGPPVPRTRKRRKPPRKTRTWTTRWQGQERWG